MYVGIYVSSDGIMRLDLESRLIENGETVEHGAFICLPPITYQVDLIAKTYEESQSMARQNTGIRAWRVLLSVGLGMAQPTIVTLHPLVTKVV